MYTGLTFVFDIDGTICPIKKKNEEYIDLVPYKEMVERLREYRDCGARIVLFTSRNMNSYNGNIGLINANTAKVMLEWLEKWDIPYDEIIYGKPWPGHRGFYVDDRAVRPDEFLKYSEEELNEICRRSKEEYDREG
ncbi:HAD family hydrolase [Konateibacter massiliensis]|uniref:capsular biosynthesis protein n=1 Tax=Konateibacter massiliensis TaxID=2002841 RepID=UPI000C157DBE|nr:capsular biosynthesis protein [Konateibacter massiliensis]